MTISGFLASYLLLKELNKSQRSINFLGLYLRRYIRLTAPYAIVIGFYATIFASTGDGPLWSEKMFVEQQRCIDTWWANLLYISNYISKEQTVWTYLMVKDLYLDHQAFN